DNALSKAINYISKTLKTKVQVINYLRTKGYEDEIVFKVIDKLKEYNYIDDVEYAKKYLEFSSKKQGAKLSNYKLMAKGIRKEDLEKANQESEIRYDISCEKVLEKYLRNKEKTKENLIKASRYLLGKGFNYEDIENAVSKLREEDGEDFNS
ncbi:MAG: regulatory protein RecX, partial [Firmicutes bacterium]|nr:regulatory protein RecX [Candidatus Caballimonas caccae]